jgi:D-alanyl-lipoteichoic acid acyltransferase DltB (MBOAT superfamily)
VSIASLEFLTLLLAFTATFPRLPEGALKRGVLAVCNVVWLALFLPNLESWLALAVFLGSGYGVALALRVRPSRLLFAGYLAALLTAFVVWQRYAFVGWIAPEQIAASAVRVVGLSYMLFRQIHFVVDSMQGQIVQPTLGSYLNYQLNLFTLLAGPIMRYPEFVESWRDLRPPALEPPLVMKAYLRILVGMLKIAGLGALCLLAYDKVGERMAAIASGSVVASDATVLGLFLVAFYAYPAYVYFNFSGYCDVVIAGAALIGMKIPENFDRPYLARNMIDYWNRWHRTLGLWIRDYLFTPMYKALAERSSRWAPRLAFLCYFVALFLAGVWHGSTFNWVIFGLLNGAGVAAAKAWETFLVARRGRKGLRAYLADRRIRALAIAANVHFACATMLFIPEDLRRTFAMLRAVAAALRP